AGTGRAAEDLRRFRRPGEDRFPPAARRKSLAALPQARGRSRAYRRRRSAATGGTPVRGRGITPGGRKNGDAGSKGKGARASGQCTGPGEPDRVAVAARAATGDGPLALHVIGAECPRCGKKGLVAGALAAGLSNVAGFRPVGWRLDVLPVQGVVCPHCGVVTTALPGKALKKLRELLRAERISETVTYHSIGPKRRKKPGGRDGGEKVSG
ncbi:MAG: hypothetical protein N3A38_14985, partial [Planctomycetota bacterium]|nr:hypothetical protein [Planctomycetota bacterium]